MNLLSDLQSHIFSYLDSTPTSTACVQLTIAWSALYLVSVVVLPHQSKDFCNRVISIIHALLALYLTALAVDWSSPYSGLGEKTTPAEKRALLVSTGYFLYDFICCLIIDQKEYANSLHHLLTLAGLYIGVFKLESGAELTGCLIMMEASNPFMHTRSLLKELKLGDTTAATINDVVFALTFLVCRIIFGVPLTYLTVMSENTSIVVKIGGVGILVVSLFWMYKIARVAIYKTTKGKKKNLKKKA